MKNSIELYKHTDASFPIRGQFVAGITNTFKGSVHINAFAVIAHARLPTFVHIDTERSNSRAGKSFITDALK